MVILHNMIRMETYGGPGIFGIHVYLQLSDSRQKCIKILTQPSITLNVSSEYTMYNDMRLGYFIFFK